MWFIRYVTANYASYCQKQGIMLQQPNMPSISLLYSHSNFYWLLWLGITKLSGLYYYL